MELNAKELIELTKEIDQMCIGFAEWMSNLIHRNYKSDGYWFEKGEIKTTKYFLEIYKKEKGL